MTHDIGYDATPGPMTPIGDAPERGALVGLPTDPADIAAAVRGLVLHPFLAELYGVEVPEDHLDDVQIRPVADVIERLLDADDRPLVEPPAPERRFFGNCRHLSTLTVALLRHAGVPRRARCGFGSYFRPGKWFIRGNVARGRAALNKVEMLRWDGWGEATEDEPPGGHADVDELAMLIGSGDLGAIRHRYESDDGLRVPPRVTAFFTRHGATDVDVPELISRSSPERPCRAREPHRGAK